MKPPSPARDGGSDGHDEHNAVVRQLRARREASYRLPVLDCGCRDPLGCRHYDDDGDAWELSNTREEERVALVADLRTLWRLGHRRLAVRLARWLGAA